MKKEDIHWDDWHRIFIGSAPTHFLFEVLLRTIFMYLVLLVILRLMGKRMGGQLTTTELAIMITLGAIICVPMQIPDKGVIQGAFVLICALVFHRIFTLIVYKNKNWEKIIQGREIALVKDGMIVVKELKKSDLSRQQLYSVLRSQHIYNLGEVERIYIEGSGLFSVFRASPPRPGLSIFPASDDPVHNTQLTPDQNVSACIMCGRTTQDDHEKHSLCVNCGCEKWAPAILS